MWASQVVLETAGSVVSAYTNPCLEEPAVTRRISSGAREQHLPSAVISFCGWRLSCENGGEDELTALQSRTLYKWTLLK